MLKLNRKGFTLIELLVVIGIIAVLAVVVILTLNPAELLRQSRDSNRLSDTGTLKSAISLYLADVSAPVIGTSGVCYLTVSATSTQAWGNNIPATWRTGGYASTTCGVFIGGTSSTITNPKDYVTSTMKAVDSTGWVPVNFTAISSGAPIGNLPTDPTNNSSYYYAYAASTTALLFEIDAHMESTKYATTSGTNAQNNDGGDSPLEYETGTILNL